MKKLYTTLLALSLATASFAQQLSNNGFEQWETSTGNPGAFDPTGYTSTNQCYDEPAPTLATALELCINNVEKTTDSYSGDFAAKLTVGTPEAPRAAAVLTTSDFLAQLNEEVVPPTPFDGRPTGISAYVKFATVDGDEGSIMVTLYDGEEVIGGAYVTITEEDESYYKIEGEIEYEEEYTGTPDGIDVGFSPGVNPGSVLFVDDVTLTYLTTSAYSAVSPVNVFTDVQTGNLHFSKKVEEVSFTDMTGKTIQTSGTSTEDVSTAGMHAGMYMVRYTYNSNTYVGKIVLQ